MKTFWSPVTESNRQTFSLPCMPVPSDAVGLGRITAGKGKSLSERVVLRLPLSGVVVTWFVTVPVHLPFERGVLGRNGPETHSGHGAMRSVRK